MTAKYQLYKDKAGQYRFRLVAENGRTIATGEAYERRASCLNGIESVKKNSDSPTEDTTIDSPKTSFPKYQIFLDKAGEFRFNLSASNGEVIASSEGYSSKNGCLNGIDAVKRVSNSEIEDLTAEVEKKEVTPLKEPKPAVTQKETKPSKEPEPSVPHKEENNKLPRAAAVAVPSKEIATSDCERQIKRNGISGISILILVVGLVIGFILLAIGLGFAGVLTPVDVIPKTVMLIAGELALSLSVILFFAKK